MKSNDRFSEEYVSSLEDQRNRLLQELDNTNRQLSGIYNSDMFKMARVYYKVRDMILPPNSLRRRFVKIILGKNKYSKKIVGASELPMVVNEDSSGNVITDHLENFFSFAEERGGYVRLKGTCLNFDRSKLVLLVSHELDYTGAPIALGHMAETYVKLGLCPIFFSRHDGQYASELVEKHIPVVFCPDFEYTDVLGKYSALFMSIVVNTFALSPVIAQLSGSRTPVLWWIHESKSFYESQPRLLDCVPAQLESNIHVVCAGEYAKSTLLTFFPDFHPAILLYSVPEKKDHSFAARDTTIVATEKKIITVVGTIEPRKGYGVLISALNMLPDEVISDYYFVFVGRNCYNRDYEALSKFVLKHESNSAYFEKLTRQEMSVLYKQTYCLVCASNDDPMPIVVAEALQQEKLVICSENTGYKTLIPKYHAGFIFKNNDPTELSRIIVQIENDSQELDVIRRNGKKLFEELFATRAFEKRLRSVVENAVYLPPREYEAKGNVSVVLPVYNGLSDLRRLIPALKKQEGLNSLQIVAIDSGSTDGSRELLEENDVTVFSIPHEKFSHSYARNLGFSKTSGEFVLFMTQDALPDGSLWARQLIDPLFSSKEIVASTCKQTPRPDCDIYGASNIFFHNTAMGLAICDRISQMPIDKSNKSLIRMNAQLDDVTTVIKREVFASYLYRGAYAEDLDLGIRLISDGYKIIQRATVRVIHSHNRGDYYHYSRAIVDIVGLRKILEEAAPRLVSDMELVSAICNLFLFASLVATKISNIVCDKENWFKETLPLLNASAIEVAHYSCQDYVKKIQSDSRFDSRIKSHVLMLLGSQKIIKSNDKLINRLKSVYENNFREFMVFSNWKGTDTLNKNISTWIIKRSACEIGVYLGEYLSSVGDAKVNNAAIEEIYNSVVGTI